MYYACLNGLMRDELHCVPDPADVMGPNYTSETFRVLKNNEERQFGEYCTRRLVLERCNRLFAGNSLNPNHASAKEKNELPRT